MVEPAPDHKKDPAHSARGNTRGGQAMQPIRDVLRRVLMGKRYAKYWRELRSFERDPRSRYHRPAQEAGRNDKRK